MERRGKSRVITTGGLLVSLLAAAALARHKPTGEDVHRKDAPCQTCHTTADGAALTASPVKAGTLLRPDLDAVCNKCHSNLGPSHKVNVVEQKPIDVHALPLGAGKMVTCYTCHFMHGETNQFSDFLRIDNRRGKLCLSCHTMSELERG